MLQRIPFLSKKSLKKTAVAGVVLAFAIAATPHIIGAQAPSNQPSAQTSVPWAKIDQVLKAPKEYVGWEVLVRAKILSVDPPDPGSKQPYAMYIQDATGTSKVIIWSKVWDTIPNVDKYQKGVIIDAKFRIGEYRNERQLELEQGTYIRMAPIDQNSDAEFRENRSDDSDNNYAMMTIGGLTLANIGQNVRLRGTVASVAPSPKERVPTKVILRDKTGEIEVIYWEEVDNAIPVANRPMVGMPWEIRGKVDEWKGQLQIKILEPGLVGRPAEEAPKSQTDNSNPFARPAAGSSSTPPQQQPPQADPDNPFARK